MGAVRGRVDPRLLCAAALAWGVAVISAGFWVPFYRTARQVACVPGDDRCTPGVVSEGTATLVGVNGVEVVAVLAIPSIASVLVGVLMFAALRGSRSARRVAWALVAAFALMALVSGFSVGLWFVPSVVLLIIAVTSIDPFLASRQATATPT